MHAPDVTVSDSSVEGRVNQVLQQQHTCANRCRMDPALMAANALQRRHAMLLAIIMTLS